MWSGGQLITESGTHIGASTGTAAALASSNPVLGPGVVGYATDTDVAAIGDGSTAWNDLPKFRPSTDPVVKTNIVAQTLIGNTITDVVGLNSCIFTVTAQPWLVMLDLPWVTGVGGVAATGLAYIRTSADVTVQSAVVFLGSTGFGRSMCLAVISTPGTYNLKGSLQRNGGAATIGNCADLDTLQAKLIASPITP